MYEMFRLCSQMLDMQLSMPPRIRLFFGTLKKNVERVFTITTATQVIYNCILAETCYMHDCLRAPYMQTFRYDCVLNLSTQNIC